MFFNPPIAVVQFTGPISQQGPNGEAPFFTIATFTFVPAGAFTFA